MRIDCKCGKRLTEDLDEALADFDEYGSVIVSPNAFGLRIPDESEWWPPNQTLGKMKSGVFFYTPERHPHRDIGEGPTMLTFTPLGLGVAEIPHIPTGIVVSQQDEKSQIRNKEKGLKILRSRIYELERQKKENERSIERKNKIGTGDRSERIRTYNFPQGRITDHRINLTFHKLEEFMEGEIFDQMIENLNLQAEQEKLKNLS